MQLEDNKHQKEVPIFENQEERLCCVSGLAGVCQGACAEHIFAPHQLWDQIRISTHSQPTSYGIRLGALYLQPTITQQQVRESHHPHQTPRYVPSVRGGVESGRAPRSRLPGLGVCTRGFEKDGSVISVVNLIRYQNKSRESA